MSELLDGSAGAIPLRQKDLALLVYLRLEPRPGHSRNALAALLWDEQVTRRARHSLSQAVRHLRLALGSLVATSRSTVELRGDLSCDAADLDVGAVDDDATLSCYAGDFLVDLTLGAGAEEFNTWADGRRAHLRRKAIAILDARCERAFRAGDWSELLQLARRLIEIEPLSESAHRRIISAWLHFGERGFAIRHYRSLERLLWQEVGARPDAATVAVLEQAGWQPHDQPAQLLTAGRTNRRQQRAELT